MNLFEVVKASINTQEAAQMYGIDANHHGMALCPFQNDRHPSLYVSDDHYHCFAKAQQLRENEQLCFSVLNEYRRLLLDWEKRYAPQTPEDVLDERFVEACHRLPWAEYQLDILLQGDSYERGETVSNLTADGYIRKLQARLREERYHEQPCLDR